MTAVSERLRQAAERDQIRRMRFVSLLEGATLVVLLFVAVPLKHLGIYREATSIIGPVHGLAFMLYI
jgi:integral membrane protein